jgi:hypothetical protein
MRSTALWLSILLISVVTVARGADDAVEFLSKYELAFLSNHSYDNPLYDVEEFHVLLTSPSGRKLVFPGFWDGGKNWKIRFSPDETGIWQWATVCSDKSNAGLHGQTGAFECISSSDNREIIQRGGIKHLPGRYHLSYGDGTPWFWIACTAWNGGLLAEDADWEFYLQNRKDLGFNAIQFVTTQWRGASADKDGDVAFSGSGRIEINPGFFRQMDKKVDMINDHGMLAVPVLLWALPFGAGRHYSPGYYLPIAESVKLARYIVARYQGNQVVWFLGGDGKYDGALEDRWKAIGQGVFGDIAHAPVTLHPHGRSFIGHLYGKEPWYTIMGYQSSHSYAQSTVEWVNRGPVNQHWDRLRSMPWINLEPLYENIHENQTEEHVRNAIWWSLMATPVAGISYGANGIWSWLEADGQQIQNHRTAPWTLSWKNSLDLPVGRQMQHVVDFFRDIPWWDLYPMPELLARQPGDAQYDRYVSLLGNDNATLLVAYVPQGSSLHLSNGSKLKYAGRWYDPVQGIYRIIDRQLTGITIELGHGADYGMVLLLQSN